MIYADWLEEQGDVRGEYLRRQLNSALGDDARLRELEGSIDSGWIARFRPPTVDEALR